MILQDMLLVKILGSKDSVVCAREGGANTTSYFLAAHFAKRNTKFGGGGKRGRAKIPSPQPPSFLPARVHGIVCAARSAASCRFSEIFDKIGSSGIVKTHHVELVQTAFVPTVVADEESPPPLHGAVAIA